MPDFAHVLFQWLQHSGRFAERAVQTTSMAHLTAVRFAAMRIPVPSLSEQEQIAEAVSSLNDAIRNNEAHLDGLRSTKDALLSVLLTGEVRVTPDPEPEC